MNGEQLPGQIIFVLICVVAALGLWSLGQRRGNLKFKQLAVMVGIVPVIGIGIELVGPYFTGPAEYRTQASGPVSGEEFVIANTMIPVTDPTLVQELQLTGRILGGNPPTEPLHLKFEVRAPSGEVLQQGELDAAPTQALKWAPVFVRFQTRVEGEHSLRLTIPNRVNRVEILARERKN
jgi:hypothetical protein